MDKWDRRYAAREYPTDQDPSPVLRALVTSFPDGRALDVGTGPGRNALFLAGEGYEVDAIDKSREGLELAREQADERGVEVNWIRADAREYAYPTDAYDVVTASFYRPFERLTDVKGALAEDGVLFLQQHVRTTDETAIGPTGDRYRLAANELLRATLDLTVLHYEERIERRTDGERSAVSTVVARNSHEQAQSYPDDPRPGEVS
ncbi:MAG: methyltransferase domain-containing protein [Halobacteriales archaeon]